MPPRGKATKRCPLPSHVAPDPKPRKVRRGFGRPKATPKPKAKASAKRAPQKEGARAEAAAALVEGPEEEIARFQRAAASLRPGGWEGELPCREEEQGTIKKFLRTAVQEGGSVQVLYISGMPGTGKTASFMQIVNSIQNDKSKPDIVVVHINAMRLGSPTAVFQDIYRQLPIGAAGPCSASNAQWELATFFENRRPKDPVVLLLVDEIDQLVTRNQAVLYRVFGWLQLPQPRLILASISNTMDLPERLLPRVASRFVIVRVDFQPYNREQLVKILMQRLISSRSLEAFEPLVLQLCAAKVAAANGDIRKALQLCSRAVEVRLSTIASGPVNRFQLNKAVEDLLNANPAVHTISNLSLCARRFLNALLFELHHLKAEAAPVRCVRSRYSKLKSLTRATVGASGAPLDGEIPGELDGEVNFLIQKLERMAIIAQSGAVHLGRTLSLGASLDSEDLHAALEKNEDDATILELMRSVRGPLGF